MIDKVSAWWPIARKQQNSLAAFHPSCRCHFKMTLVFSAGTKGAKKVSHRSNITGSSTNENLFCSGRQHLEVTEHISLLQNESCPFVCFVFTLLQTPISPGCTLTLFGCIQFTKPNLKQSRPKLQKSNPSNTFCCPGCLWSLVSPYEILTSWWGQFCGSRKPKSEPWKCASYCMMTLKALSK